VSSDAITHTIVVAAYASAADAEADYSATESMYDEAGATDAFDGVLIARNDLGAARVVKDRAPNRSEALRGHDVGLAGGVVVNLFPRTALVGTVRSAGALAIGDCVRDALSGEDLTDLGDVLMTGHGDIAIVTTTELRRTVDKALSRAAEIVHKSIGLDEAQLRSAVQRAQYEREM